MEFLFCFYLFNEGLIMKDRTELLQLWLKLSERLKTKITFPRRRQEAYRSQKYFKMKNNTL